jgi:hypothetical protein
LAISGFDPHAFSRSSAAALAAAWLAALAVVLVWVLRTPEVWLREQLKILQFWSLETCVVLGVGLAAVLARDVLRGLGRQDVARLLLLTSSPWCSPRSRPAPTALRREIGRASDRTLRHEAGPDVHDGTVEYGQPVLERSAAQQAALTPTRALSLAYRLRRARGDGVPVNGR